MNKSSTILVVGHNDVIENALTAYFQNNNYSKVFSSSKIGLDPTIQPAVYEFFQTHRPEYVFMASTRSGGIEANQKFPAEFLYHNSESQNNLIYAARKFGVKKFLYIASSCVYPRECAQPIKEESLLTGALEKTSEAYAVAKIAGIKLCQAFKAQYGFNAVVMIPATLYGPGSDTDLEKAHVMGALIAKFAKAVKNNDKEVVVWGSGKPCREFLFVDDLVSAALFLMEKYDGDQIINAGCGYDVSIMDLATMIGEISGFKGKIVFDSSKPDGVMKKLLDSRRILEMGWKPKVDLKDGIKKTYDWFVKQNQ